MKYLVSITKYSTFLVVIPLKCPNSIKIISLAINIGKINFIELTSVISGCSLKVS
jgi:hypothetical protein